MFVADNELASSGQYSNAKFADSHDKDGSENYQNYRGGIAVNNSGSLTLTKQSCKTSHSC